MSPPDLPIDPVAAIPATEQQRIAAVTAYQAAHVGARAPYLDDIARLAAIVVGTPIGFVSLIGRDKQFFAGRYGLDMEETPREVSFCGHTINGDMPMVVADAEADPRFRNNPLVAGEPGIRFYAGAPLMSAAEGPHLGALCVIDKAVRPTLTPDQKRQLSRLATLATEYIERYTADAD
jgi:GAF domain-containing protein